MDKPSTNPSWFTILPYEFKKRFINLIPLDDLATILDLYPETHPLAKPQIEYVPFSLNYPTSLWRKNKVFFIQQVLRINFLSIAEYDRIARRIIGPYMDLQLRGTYSWKHVIQLIRPSVDYVNLKGTMQLEKHEYEMFISRLIKLGTNRNRLNIEYQGDIPMSEFRETFATTIKNSDNTALQFCTITRNNHGKHFVVSFNSWKQNAEC